LIKRGAHHLISAAADMTVIIQLPRTIATWRQAKMRAANRTLLETYFVSKGL
jgi:hypothetical protein